MNVSLGRKLALRCALRRKFADQAARLLTAWNRPPPLYKFSERPDPQIRLATSNVDVCSQRSSQKKFLKRQLRRHQQGQTLVVRLRPRSARLIRNVGQRDSLCNFFLGVDAGSCGINLSQRTCSSNCGTETIHLSVSSRIVLGDNSYRKYVPHGQLCTHEHTNNLFIDTLEKALFQKALRHPINALWNALWRPSAGSHQCQSIAFIMVQQCMSCTAVFPYLCMQVVYVGGTDKHLVVSSADPSCEQFRESKSK